MSVIKTVPEPNIWDQICKEFSKKKPPFVDDDVESVHTEYSDYDPSRHHPVFYGKMFTSGTVEEDTINEFDAAVSHPACVGYSFSEKPAKAPSPPPPLPPNKEECTPTEYLNHYVFPWLLPALEEMLKQAKLEKCFEEETEEEKADKKRRRTKFNACDFITEYLYKHNPHHKDEGREEMVLWDIPFVQDWLKDHPRPPLPMSLIWTDEEAALIIQNFWRGYLVRREPEVQELRIWQREWREENRGIQDRVSEFWEKQMPEGDEPTPQASEEQIDQATTDETPAASLSQPDEQT